LTCGGSPRALGAWPLAWSSPSGPQGRQRLRAQGWVPKMLSAKRLEKIFECLCGWRGPPGQCAAFRSPMAVTFIRRSAAPGASVTAWSCSWGAASGRYGGDRLRPVPGKPCAAAAASAGPSSEGRERSCRSATARPRRPEPPMPGPPAANSLPRLLAPARVAGPGPSGVARRRCALEYARHGRSLGGESPLEEEVVLTPSRRQLRRREAGWEGSPRRNPAPGNTNRV